jgi:hypothetical protein
MVLIISQVAILLAYGALPLGLAPPPQSTTNLVLVSFIMVVSINIEH